MKKIIPIIGTIVVIGLVAWGVWFFAFSKGPQGVPLSNLSGLLPWVSSQNAAPVQRIVSPENPEVAKAFLGEAQNVSQVTLGGTVVASPYALQIWGNTNAGGEALLEQTSSTGWTLVSLGGGEWSLLGLMQEGVPQSAAEQLVAGLTSGATSPVASTINIPAGNTITIGTSEGSVTMNNFYRSASYIAQEQKAVVIQQTSTYDIVYNVSDSSFAITVFSVPFEAVRQTAEAAFLNSLGVSRQDACKLMVHENVSGGVASQYAGASFSLSFCPGAVSTP
jgi:hypothetical protein